MALDTREFLAEMQQLQERKHSRKHPLFEMIEEGQLTRPQLNGFIKQFYLLFPKPFPKPIAAMFARAPQDTELERMWFENLSEEAEGGETGTAGHKELYIRFAEAAGIPRDELNATQPLPETRGLLNWRELLIGPALVARAVRVAGARAGGHGQRADAPRRQRSGGPLRLRARQR